MKWIVSWNILLQNSLLIKYLSNMYIKIEINKKIFVFSGSYPKNRSRSSLQKTRKYWYDLQNSTVRLIAWSHKSKIYNRKTLYIWWFISAWLFNSIFKIITSPNLKINSVLYTCSNTLEKIVNYDFFKIHPL